MKKRKLRFDKVLVFVNVCLVALFIVSASFSKAWLSKVNIDLESTKQQLQDQTKLNESLEMKINELASIDNIQSVATTYGLGYNNSNIVNIED